MDNKQDKQFYWEVKDFLNRKPSNTEKKAKPESLKESIQKMLVSGNNLHTPKVLTEESNKEVANELSYFSESLLKNVNSLLSFNEENIKKNTPECKAFTANNPNNIFNIKKNINLNEAPGFGNSENNLTYLERRKRQRDEENYEINRERLREKEAAEREELASRRSNIKTRQNQDKISSFQKDLADEIGGPLSPEDEAREGESFDEYQTRLGSTKRNMVGNRRERQRIERVSGEIAGRVERLSSKKPEELTAQENAQLMMDRIMMQGKSATPGLEGKVREKISTSVGSRMEEVPNLATELDQNALSVTAQQEIDMAAGKRKDTKRIQSEVDRMLSSTTGRSVEDLRTSTQTAVGREEEQKQKEREKEAEAYKEAQYQKMRGQRIQGTNTTYGDFEDQTGRRFNAVNKDDSLLVNKLAGAGRYGSEQARQTALSADQFNRMYGQQRDRMDKKLGQLERAADKSTFEVARFRTDKDYRDELRNKDIAGIVSKPGFVRGIANEIKTATEAEIERRRLEKLRTGPSSKGIPELLKDPGAPTRLSTPGLLQKDSTVPTTPDLLQRPIPNYGGAGSMEYGKTPDLLKEPEGLGPVSSSSPSLINSFTARNPIRQTTSVEDQIKRLRGER